jgi:hypothetical protein
MGKRSDFPRRERDSYDTPFQAVSPLLGHIEPGAKYLEPCAGSGRFFWEKFMTDENYGPWIDHDGKGFPYSLDLQKGEVLQTTWSSETGARYKTPLEQAQGCITDLNPGWTWRWRRKWLSGKRLRVCRDREYQPIIRYRLCKPPARTAEVQALAEIAANPKPAKIKETEHQP